MKFIRNTIKTIIRWAVMERTEDPNRDAPMPVGYGSLSSNSLKGVPVRSMPIDEFNNGFNFTVFDATGGKVVRVHSYDPKTDRHISNLYIITDKEDFGEELAQIITRDSLSR